MPTYVRRNGEKLGPFEDAQLLSSLQQGIFSYDDLALRDGWTDWKPLRSLFAPPVSGSAVTHSEADASVVERRVWSGRRSHWNFFVAWLFALAFLASGAVCLWIYFNRGNEPLLFVPAAIGVILLLYIYIVRARQLYVVTN